jgi:rod shape determining protein RodA
MSYTGNILIRNELTLKEKLANLNWTYFFFIACLACVGFLMLYSAAGGKTTPWVIPQAMKFAAGLFLAIAIALIDIKFWFRYSYAFYFISLMLLVAVEIKGDIGMGAQRWLNLGFFTVQPSELMKISLILVLARYFHSSYNDDIRKNSYLIFPALLTLIPAALILKQPDLGTGSMLMMIALILFFLSGVQIWKFLFVGGIGLAIIPIAWQFLHDYQKQRIFTFLDPERDPLGSGYHIIQSKIAFGSGKIFGKGYLNGTQSHLNFLPEKHTDFIFTMFAEEFGLTGSLILLMLFGIIIIYGFYFASQCQNYFGKILALGLISNFTLYVIINTSMVMGLIPVVGVPLPLISYGGTAMISLMAGFGFIQNVYVHREIHIGRKGSSNELLEEL